MSAKGLTMTVVAVAVAAGTYYALDTAFPAATPGSALEQNGGTVARVFEGSLREPAAGGGEVAQPVVADSAAVADDGSAEAGGMDDATAMADDSSYGAEPAASDYGADTTLSEPAAEPAPAETAMAEPEPMPESEPEPMPEPTPAPPTATAAPAKPASKPAAASTAPQKLTQWWGPASDAQLSIVYAGSAAYTRAIVLMLNGAFDEPTSANQNVRVTDAAGKTVSGQWQIGANNKRMLLFPVTKAGTYTVAVKADLTDRSGRKLGKAQKGPVRVQ